MARPAGGCTPTRHRARMPVERFPGTHTHRMPAASTAPSGRKATCVYDQCRNPDAARDGDPGIQGSRRSVRPSGYATTRSATLMRHSTPGPSRSSEAGPGKTGPLDLSTHHGHVQSHDPANCTMRWGIGWTKSCLPPQIDACEIAIMRNLLILLVPRGGLGLRTLIEHA
jgi:hypothetical protein